MTRSIALEFGLLLQLLVTFRTFVKTYLHKNSSEDTKEIRDGSVNSYIVHHDTCLESLFLCQKRQGYPV